MKLYKRKRLAALALSVLVLASCRDTSDDDVVVNDNSISLHSELGGDAAGYQRACTAVDFNFPEDHGAHRDFRNEWWYITGNLQSSTNTRYGFHATFFRIANKPLDASELLVTGKTVTSSWAADEFYMAHFAITQEGREQALVHEKFSRAAAGLAGAEVNKLVDGSTLSEQKPVVKVWLDDWQLLAHEKDGNLVWQIQIKQGSEALNLTLVAKKPVVLQGDKGYSQKSQDPCNSSYYYSISRLQAKGTIVIDEQSVDVSGSAWLDREWSSSALADNQVGWDWFALQMDDGRDIMFYQLRQKGGKADPYSYAVEIDRNGNKTIFSADQFKLTIDRWWQSATGARYPISGTLYRNDTHETIKFRPLIDNQELDLTVRYWEGAITLSDENDLSIGRGYLELTGY